MSPSQVLAPIADLTALLVVPPLLIGIINRTKAIIAGRRGPPLLQPYWDILRLARKSLVISHTTTWIFQAAPLVTLLSVLLAGLLVPLGPGGAPLSFEGDLILFAYLFALGRFFTTAAALDTGSPFEAMGASRELTYALLAEPALFFALLCLTRLSGSLSLDLMLQAPAASHAASLVLVVLGLFVLILLECSRVPFDDPTTHLELTMIHEVMVLDHSGPLLGAIHYAAAMKLFVLGTVLVRVALPVDGSPWLTRLATLGGLLALAVAIGLVESATARVRLTKIPNLAAGAILATAFAFVLMLR